MADGVVFSVSTDLVVNGRELKALKPDKDGIYKAIPLTVIGAPSRNNVSYEKNSVIECLTNPNSRFVMNLKSGDLEGEWCHPLMDPTDKKKMVQRLLYLDRARVSHHFTKIYAKDIGGGKIIVYGDVKPSGPFGKYLEENFQDPTRNVSFSMRSATVVDHVSNGITYKRMLAMFTFDAVDGPGYEEASKRFQDTAGLEGLKVLDNHKGASDIDVTVNKEDFLAAQKSFEASGLESNSMVDKCLIDAFGRGEIIMRGQKLIQVKGGYANESGARVSLFDQAFGL